MSVINKNRINAIKNKALFIKSKNLKLSSAQFRPSRIVLNSASTHEIITNFLDQLNKWTQAALEVEAGNWLHPKWETKGARELIVEYLAELDDYSLTTLITYLCYYKNGLDQPEILQLLDKQVNNSSATATAAAKVIIEFSGQLSQTIKEYKIDKVNAWFANQEGMEVNFISTLKLAKNKANNLLNTFHLTESIKYEAKNIKKTLYRLNLRNNEVAPAKLAQEILKSISAIEKSIISAYDGSNTSTEFAAFKTRSQPIQDHIQTIKQAVKQFNQAKFDNKKLRITITERIEKVAEGAEKLFSPAENDKVPLQLALLKNELDKAAQRITNYHKIVKGGGVIDAATSLLNGGIVPVILYSAIADMGLANNEIIKHNYLGNEFPHGTEGATALGGVSQLFTGILWAINRQIGIGISSVEKQAIGVYKNYLLQLIKQYHQQGGRLSAEEERFYRKFLAIKRGNKFTDFFRPKWLVDTQSAAKFDKILLQSSGTDTQARNLEDTLSATTEKTTEDIKKGNLSPEAVLVKDFEEGYYSFVNLKYKLQNLIESQNFSELNKLLETISQTNNHKIKNILPIITFKNAKLRGNLLTHILEAERKNPQDEAIKNCLTQVIGIITDPMVESSELFKKISSLSFIDTVAYIQEIYKVTNKYSFLIDWQHILLAIKMNSQLTQANKKELFQILHDELNNKSEGKFRAIRIKRNKFSTEAALGGLFYQAWNLKNVAELSCQSGLSALVDQMPGHEVAKHLEDALISHTTAIVGYSAFSVSCALFSILNPLSEYLSRGNTTTFKTALRIVENVSTSVNLDNLVNAKKIASQSDNFPSLVEADNTEDSPPQPIKTDPIDQTNLVTGDASAAVNNDRSILNSVFWLQAHIHKVINSAKSIEELQQDLLIFSELTSDNKKTIYFALNSVYEGEILFNSVLNKIEQLTDIEAAKDKKQNLLTTKPLIDGSNASELAQSKGESLLNSLLRLWGEIVKEEVEFEITHGAYPQLRNSSITQWSMSDFEQYIAFTSNFNTANDALKHLYKILGIIQLDVSLERRAAKMAYLSSIIHRAKFDNTSRWVALRKRSEKELLIMTTLLRLSLCAISGGISIALLSTGVGAAIVIPVLLFISALRGVLGSLINNLELKNTKQYKNAMSMLSQAYANLDDSEKQQVYAMLRQQKNTTYEKIEELIQFKPSAGQEAKLAKSQTLQHKFEAIMLDYRREREQENPTNFLKATVATDARTPAVTEEFNLPVTSNSPEAMKLIQEIQLLLLDSGGIIDKYMASQSLFKIVAVVYKAELAIEDKLNILLQLTYLFKERAINFGVKLSEERDYIRKQNYFINDILIGLVSTIPSILGISDLGIPVLCQGIAAPTIGVSLNLYTNLSTATPKKNNTASYQKCMKFLKYSLIYFLTELKSSELDHKLIKNYEQEVMKILKNHTGRSIFTRVGDTASYKEYQAMSGAQA
jgi:hypothetical protein